MNLRANSNMALSRTLDFCLFGISLQTQTKVTSPDIADTTVKKVSDDLTCRGRGQARGDALGFHANRPLLQEALVHGAGFGTEGRVILVLLVILGWESPTGYTGLVKSGVILVWESPTG